MNEIIKKLKQERVILYILGVLFFVYSLIYSIYSINNSAEDLFVILSLYISIICMCRYMIVYSDIENIKKGTFK